MGQQHGDLAGLIGLEQVNTGPVTKAVGCKEALEVDAFQVGFAEEISQRGGQVGFQDNGLPVDLDALQTERVVQLQLAGTAGAQLGQAAIEAEKRGGRE